MTSYQPLSFDEYIGQKRIVNNLKLYLTAAAKQHQTLDHVFIHGNSGMGKTALANLIAHTMQTKIYLLNGHSLQKASDIISVLTNLKGLEIIFIDEVHAVSKEVLELLYPAIDTGKITIIFGKEYNAKTISLNLPKFTLIVATTELNEIPLPFYNRFSINFKLENYTNEEMGQIIVNFAKFLNLNLSQLTATHLANFSRNNPRNALNLTKRINDFYLTGIITDLTSTEQISQAMERLGIYPGGLTSDDLKYLTLLKENKVLGLENLSHLLNISTKIVRQIIEPLLIEKNLIIRTSKGRILTSAGINFLSQIKTDLI